MRRSLFSALFLGLVDGRGFLFDHRHAVFGLHLEHRLALCGLCCGGLGRGFGDDGVAVRLIFGLGIACNRDDLVAGIRLRERDALRGAAGEFDLAHIRADHLAGFHDCHDLVFLAHDDRADERAAFVGELHGLDAEAVAALQAVFADRGALGEALVRDDEQVLVGLAPDHIHRKQFVARAELHALHAGGLAAHRSQLLVVSAELQAHAELRHENDVVGRIAQRGADELVGGLAGFVLHQPHGDQTALTRRIVFGKARLLHLARARGEHKVIGHLVVRDRQHGLDRLVGRELQRQYGQEPQCILTMPLLVGLDGVQKMSKSKKNYIGITDPANDMFGKVMSITDDLMWNWYDLLSLRSNAEIAQLKKECAEGRNPRDAKVLLAREIIERFHDKAAADAAEAEFNARFQKGAVPNDIKDVTVAAPTGEIGIMQLIKAAGLAPSNAEAGRNIDQGGVRIDGESVRDRTLKIQAGAEFVLQVGKRRWARVKVTAQ